MRFFPLLFALTFVLGCEEGASTGSEDPDADGKADAVDEDIRDELRTFDDPIARWLVDNVDEDGVTTVPYLDMLRGIAKVQGCGETDEEADRSIDSYVISDGLVVQGDKAFPRVVNTVCSKDRLKADEAFFALSFPNRRKDDVEARRVEMFAWDEEERRYRFYKTVIAGTGASRVKLEPSECKQCHLTPVTVDKDFQPMTPIMNELAAPWEHWFATPQSVNHSVPSELHDAPVFGELAGNRSEEERSPFLKSAAQLEQTIRSSYNARIALTRVGVRREKPADVEKAMSALRPLFCDEQLSYVSEDGESGLLSVESIIDGGWFTVFEKEDHPWDWWNPPRQLRLPADRDGDDAIGMMPVRGASVVAYEQQLVSVRGVKTKLLARVRALDWRNAAMSDFRCDLYEQALERVVDDPPIEITDSTRNKTLYAPLLEATLVLRPQELGLEGDLPEAIPIVPDTDGNVVALATADLDSLQALAEALVAEELAEQTCTEDGEGLCEVDLPAMGDMLQAWMDTVADDGRGPLQRLRNQRGCVARGRYKAFPFIPDLENCE